MKIELNVNWITVVHSGQTEPFGRIVAANASVTDHVGRGACLSRAAHPVPTVQRTGLPGRFPDGVPSATGHTADHPCRQVTVTHPCCQSHPTPTRSHLPTLVEFDGFDRLIWNERQT